MRHFIDNPNFFLVSFPKIVKFHPYYKHFFFVPMCAKMIKDEETKAFFEFLMSNKASTDYTGELKLYVADAKQSTENKRQFMEWERQRAYDFDDGKEAGIQQQAEESAKKMLADNLSLDKISLYSGLTPEQVKELAAKMPVQAG